MGIMLEVAEVWRTGPVTMSSCFYEPWRFYSAAVSNIYYHYHPEDEQ